MTREEIDTMKYIVSCRVFHLTIQIGYGQFTIGITEKEL